MPSPTSEATKKLGRLCYLLVNRDGKSQGHMDLLETEIGDEIYIQYNKKVGSMVVYYKDEREGMRPLAYYTGYADANAHPGNMEIKDGAEIALEILARHLPLEALADV